MSWAQRRKTTYIVSILFIFLIILIIIFFAFFNKKSTCFDRIQNQGEQGIDCGGPCSLLCKTYGNPVVLWGPRWEKVLTSGTYSFLTYAQNPNIGVGALSVPYILKVYDVNNILLYQKNDFANIPPNNNFVIFEDNINLFDKVPARAELNFTGIPVWESMTSNEANITAVSKNLMNEDTAPKLMVTMRNSSLNPINNIESIAILYDQNDNAVAFSRTKIDSINAGGTMDIAFTWPEAFVSKVVRIDIVSRVLSN